jgi:poly(A)-specific ribonuclease
MTMLHTKFIAPLPPNMHEFMCSLKMVFSNVVDISHLWRQIGPSRKAKNIQAALSYLQRQYFVPIEIEIPQQGIIPANIIHTSCFLVNHALGLPHTLRNRM